MSHASRAVNAHTLPGRSPPPPSLVPDQFTARAPSRRPVLLNAPRVTHKTRGSRKTPGRRKPNSKRRSSRTDHSHTSSHRTLTAHPDSSRPTSRSSRSTSSSESTAPKSSAYHLLRLATSAAAASAAGVAAYTRYKRLATQRRTTVACLTQAKGIKGVACTVSPASTCRQHRSRLGERVWAYPDLTCDEAVAWWTKGKYPVTTPATQRDALVKKAQAEEEARVKKTQAEEARVKKAQAEEEARVKKARAEEARVKKAQAEEEARVKKAQEEEARVKKAQAEEARVKKAQEEEARVKKAQAEEARVKKAQAEEARVKKARAEEARLRKALEASRQVAEALPARQRELPLLFYDIYKLHREQRNKAKFVYKFKILLENMSEDDQRTFMITLNPHVANASSVTKMIELTWEDDRTQFLQEKKRRGWVLHFSALSLLILISALIPPLSSDITEKMEMEKNSNRNVLSFNEKIYGITYGLVFSVPKYFVDKYLGKYDQATHLKLGIIMGVLSGVLLYFFLNPKKGERLQQIYKLIMIHNKV